MGVAASYMRRTARNWNVQNRAMRAIERKNRAAPPRYPTEKKRIAEQVRQQHTPREEIPGLETVKNPVLDDWLKKVKVYSHDVRIGPDPVEHDPRKQSHEQPLPQSREPVTFNEYGYVSGERAPPGKLTMKLALELLSAYQQDRETFNVPELCRRYNLSPEDAVALTQYFRVFMLYIPVKGKETGKIVDMRQSFFDPMSAPEIRIGEKSGGELEAYNEGAVAHGAYLAEVERRNREDEATEEAKRKAKEEGRPYKPKIDQIPSVSGIVSESVEERLRSRTKGNR